MSENIYEPTKVENSVYSLEELKEKIFNLVKNGKVTISYLIDLEDILAEDIACKLAQSKIRKEDLESVKVHVKKLCYPEIIRRTAKILSVI